MSRRKKRKQQSPTRHFKLSDGLLAYESKQILLSSCEVQYFTSEH